MKNRAVAMLEEALEISSKNQRRWFMDSNGRLESPIESLFHAALVLAAVRHRMAVADRGPVPMVHELTREGVDIGGIAAWPTLGTSIGLRLTIVPQCKVGPYRADFLLSLAGPADSPARLVVECDGHDYHSSKEQIAHDRKRDRFMLARSVPVFRFTGTEINADAEDCAEQCLSFLECVALQLEEEF